MDHGLQPEHHPQALPAETLAMPPTHLSIARILDAAVPRGHMPAEPQAPGREGREQAAAGAPRAGPIQQAEPADQYESRTPVEVHDPRIPHAQAHRPDKREGRYRRGECPERSVIDRRKPASGGHKPVSAAISPDLKLTSRPAIWYADHDGYERHQDYTGH